MDFIPKVKVQMNTETEEETPNFVYSDDDIEEKEEFDSYEDEIQSKVEEFIPETTKPKEIVEKDIFIDEDEPPPPKKAPKVNKNGKQRAPMSEAHKEKLKVAREKAMLSKKVKAEERAKQKIEDAEEKKLRDLKKKKDKKKELEELKNEVYDIPKPAPAPAPAPVPIIREIVREPSITKEDIEKSQLNAIMQYENLRKLRKEEKKKKEKEEADFNHLKNKLLRAQNPKNQFSGSRGFF